MGQRVAQDPGRVGMSRRTERGEVDAAFAEADEIAFVPNTSGTTGVPKAVPYRQAPLAERTRVTTGLCGLGPG